MKQYIYEIAERVGERPEEVYAQMKFAIDAAWSTTDPDVRAFQQQLFDGPPTPEKFIEVISNLLS